MNEARLEDSGSGLAPTSDGWFVVNARDAEWMTSDTFDSGCRFESRDGWFPQVGINLSVLEPGQPNCLYHSVPSRLVGAGPRLASRNAA